MIEYRDWIVRDDLKKEPNKYFLFGDNLLKIGLGGQAREMRGEPNAIGIPTKRKPSMTEDSFFDESDLIEAIFYIDNEFDKIPKFATIVVPKDGIGTGLAELPKRAPSIYNYIQDRLKRFEKNDTPNLNIYRVDIEEDVPWYIKPSFTCYCSSLEKCRNQIVNFSESLDVICKVEDYVDTIKKGKLYELKEFYHIIEINNNNVLYNAIIKKVIIL